MSYNEEINKRFGPLNYYKPEEEGQTTQTEKHRELCMIFIQFAVELDNVLFEGRAKENAMERLEEVSMWAHKAADQNAPINWE